MSVIEGIGDEVLLLFAFCTIFILLCIAWLSTRVADAQPINLLVVNGSSFQRLLQRFAQQQLDGASSGDSERNEVVVDGADSDTSRPSTTSEVEPLAETVKTQCPANDTGESSTPISNTDNDDTSMSEPVATPGADSGTISLEELRHCRTAFYTTNKVETLEPVTATSSPDCEGTVSPPAVTTVTEDVTPEEIADNQITIRLKYLDDRQRSVYAKPDDTIGHFKSVNFADELSNNFVVRFVFNGQELRQDASTLQSYNITDNSVVHCLLTRGSAAVTPRAVASSADVAAGENSIIDWLYLPLFGIMLAIAWYSRFAYRNYFNLLSTFALVAISLLYAVVLHTAFLTGTRQAHAHSD